MDAQLRIETVAPHEYAARRAEIAARAYLKLAEAHKRFLGRNNSPHREQKGAPAPRLRGSRAAEHEGGGRGPKCPEASGKARRHAGSGLYGNLRILLEGVIESDRGPCT